LDQKDIKGGSHDSILMWFQNSSNGRYGEVPISRRTEPMNIRLRKLPTVLPCQTLIDIKRGHKPGYVPPNYVTGLHSIDKSDVSNYDVWTRYIAKVNASVDLHSYSAFNSILKSKNPAQSRIAFTPILPYPITDFESVYTVMINFQDVLKQKKP